MPNLPLLPQMPMSQAADEAAQSPVPNLGPLPPPPVAPPMGAPAMPTPQPTPQGPPYEAEVQSDGTIAAYITGPDGKKLYLGVHKPFKVPPALQPSMQPQPGMM